MTNIKFLKGLKWEFWPFWFFYIPLYVKYLWMSVKAGSMAFFTASNPIMEFGGFTDYSKYNVLKNIDKNYLPPTFLVSNANSNSVLEVLKTEKLAFPIILKPDKGERGFGVEKIDDTRELDAYFKKGEIGDLILQDYVSYPVEIGVMYSRKSSEKQGVITSVVIKEFLTLTGDGKKTLEQWFRTDSRAKFYTDTLLEIYADTLDAVLDEGKLKELISIGNHCRGTMFLDGNHLINEKLLAVFDKISIPIEGFHFGRFDLRVSSIDDLYNGENIKIMELNGAASEPAHIYDPSMSLFKAYKHLFAHWQRLYEISRENNTNGVSYRKTIDLYKALVERGNFKKTIK